MPHEAAFHTPTDELASIQVGREVAIRGVEDAARRLRSHDEQLAEWVNNVPKGTTLNITGYPSKRVVPVHHLGRRTATEITNYSKTDRKKWPPTVLIGRHVQAFPGEKGEVHLIVHDTDNDLGHYIFSLRDVTEIRVNEPMAPSESL